MWYFNGHTHIEEKKRKEKEKGRKTHFLFPLLFRIEIEEEEEEEAKKRVKEEKKESVHVKKRWVSNRMEWNERGSALNGVMFYAHWSIVWVILWKEKADYLAPCVSHVPFT